LPIAASEAAFFCLATIFSHRRPPPAGPYIKKIAVMSLVMRPYYEQ